MTVFEKFFTKLYERYYNENDLSNITWALCEADLTFRNVFFNFIFGDDLVDVDMVIREQPFGECRPDFYLRDTKNNKEYIIEIKIDDKNIHENYKDIFSSMTRAFIANYDGNIAPYNANKIYHHVKIWENFVLLLKEKINVEDDKINEIIKGYYNYLKKAIYFMEAKSMNLRRTSSLYTYNNLVSKIVKEKNLSFNNYPKGCNSDYYGHYIYTDYNKKHIEFWLGFYLNNSFPKLCIAYDPYSGPDEGEYFKKASDNTIYLKEQFNNKLNSNEIEINEQKNIIMEFMMEILNIIKKCNGT